MTTETKQYSDKELAVIERVRQQLMDGTYFLNHAASARSAIGYRPVMNRKDYSHAMATLAKMAGESDMLAQVAAGILGKVNLYGTREQADAQIYEAAWRVLTEDYDDVIGRSGPEAGRYRDHIKPWNLRVRIVLAYWLAEATAKMQSSLPGVGWCVAALARQEGVVLFKTYFPSIDIP